MKELIELQILILNNKIKANTEEIISKKLTDHPSNIVRLKAKNDAYNESILMFNQLLLNLK